MNTKVFISVVFLILTSIPSYARHNGDGPRVVRRTIQSEKIQTDIPNQERDESKDTQPIMKKNQQEEGWRQGERTPARDKKESRQARRPFRHQGALNDR